TVIITGSEDVAQLSSDSKTLTEGDAVLSTGGQLVLTDLDATAATVVVQSDVAGSYGKFSVDATGKWSYVTNDALNQLNAGQRVTETFEVATSDGGKAS
ncbi:VCBS domain-containing protein, partial [Aeromonas caviae]